jgi:hypothetical protein
MCVTTLASCDSDHFLCSVIAYFIMFSSWLLTLQHRSSVVSDIYPFASTSRVDRLVPSGGYAILDPFPIDCYPAPTVQWFDGSSQTALRGTENYHVTLGNQLVVLGAKLGVDNKVWRVTATNGYTQQTMDGPTFSLQVSSK